MSKVDQEQGASAEKHTRSLPIIRALGMLAALLVAMPMVESLYLRGHHFVLYLHVALLFVVIATVVTRVVLLFAERTK